MVQPGHDQQDQAGVAARITRISPGAYLPPPTDRQGNFCFVTLAYGRQGHDHNLGPSGRPQALNQGFQRVLGRGVKQPGKVVDVADWLSRNQRVHALGLRRYG
jgi:hypothetical protein